MRSIDIFIKSYHKDFWLLRYALMSIKKFVTGYKTVRLVIPLNEYDKLMSEISDVAFPENIRIHYSEEKSPGWLYQQYLKMSAHKVCQSEYIMFTDSDCIFTHPVNIQDCLTDGKPEILCTDWSKVDQAIIWKEPTEKFLGEEVPFEMMRRNQQIHHRSTLSAIEQFRPDLEELIMKSERFSEFNAMSAYCYKYLQDQYRFINTDNWVYTPPLAVQLWSHASRSNESVTHKQEWQRTVETINSIFGEQTINTE